MRTGELYECVESPFSYSRSWGYTPSRILLYDGWLRHRLLNELFRSLKNSAFHRLSRSVNLEYYAFLVFSNLSNRNDSFISAAFLYLILFFFILFFLAWFYFFTDAPGIPEAAPHARPGRGSDWRGAFELNPKS